MTSDLVNQTDHEVAKLKASRDRPAVLKARLALVRSKLPDRVIFVFEGDNDKAVYSQWVRRVRAELVFEPFPCDGKTRLFQLRDMLDRDLSGLQAGVYFFIDRDFDDLGGRSTDTRSFMTDRYSIENYLVDPPIIEELLKNEFHCDGQPEIRKEIAALMEKCFDQFLESTKEINFRVYLARKLGIDIVGGLPKKINELANVALLGVSSVHELPDQIVVLARTPTFEESTRLRNSFETLNARSRYRGKFSFLFLMKWLDLLATDRSRDTPILFRAVDRRKTVRIAQISAALLATLSPLPQGFADFVQSVALS